MVSTTPEAEALRPALRFLEVDEDTFESLTEVVADTASENAEQGPNELAALLQDALEPFLLALGAEQTSIPGVAMQVAVSLRGLPSLEHEPKKGPVEPTKERLPDPVSICVSSQTQPGENKKTSMTLADFCSGAAAPRPANNVQVSTSSSAPRTLGSIWTAQANSAADAVSNMLDLRPLSSEHDEKFEEEHNQEFVEDDEVRAPQGFVGSSTSSAQDGANTCGTKRRAGGTKAARRAAAAAATTSGTQSSSKVAAEQEANLQEIAAHGLRETQLAVETSEGSGKRGIHIEGPGSRNVHLENISLSIAADSGTVELLRETDLHLQAGHVYGLVGRNGAGKTTLMRRLAARALPGAPQHLRFGYVAQELAALSGVQTPVEAVVASDVERCDLLKKHAELDASLEGAESFQDADTIAAAEIRAQQLVEVERQLEAIDADGADKRARTMLLRLGLDEAMLRRQVSELSGGWQMRVALAAALSIRPDVLLLDEPTNHLDLHGVLWLQEHLHREWGAGSSKKDKIVVIVSHDRSFLDACATDILEIHSCKLRNFTGNYSSYIDRIAQERKTVFAAKQDADQQAKEAKKEMQVMKKKARDHEDDKKVRQLKSKEKKLERTAAHDHDRRFKLTSACELGRCILPDTIEELRQKMREDTSLRFRFPEADLIGDANLLEIDDARIRQGRQVILHNVTLTLDSRSRVAIVGSNGSGKSTLMRALAREIKAEEGPKGRGRVHPAYDPGFVSQNHLERQSQYLHLNCLEFLRESLPDEKTLRVEHGAAMTKQSDDSVLRAHLGNFGLGKDALKKVGVLSGGQRARLSLAVGTSRQPSLLLLDEPTNHLDVDSLDALSFGLQAFEGAVVVVSHNRGFLQALCDELWIVRNGSVTACPRGEEAFTEFFAEYARGVHASLK